MTLGELYEAVSYLGFETELGDEVQRRGFYAVLGRALQTVDRISPRLLRVALVHIAPRNLLSEVKERSIADGETLSFALPKEARTVALSLFGVGSVCISDASGEREIPFSSLGENALSFAVKSPEQISVSAEREVTLGGIGAYAELSPLGKMRIDRGVCYDIKRLCPDFAAFSSPAVYLEGMPYLGRYELRGSEVLLASDAPSGLYEIECRLAMPCFSPHDSPSRELPLAPELAALLPELVASMIWLDDAPEKAAYYASIYQRGYAQLRAEKRDGRALSVLSTNGW